MDVGHLADARAPTRPRTASAQPLLHCGQEAAIRERPLSGRRERPAWPIKRRRVNNPERRQSGSTKVPTTIAGNATPTFGMFLDGLGTAVPFDPAKNRIFVRFREFNLGSTRRHQRCSAHASTQPVRTVLTRRTRGKSPVRPAEDSGLLVRRARVRQDSPRGRSSAEVAGREVAERFR